MRGGRRVWHCLCTFVARRSGSACRTSASGNGRRSDRTIADLGGEASVAPALGQDRRVDRLPAPRVRVGSFAGAGSSRDSTQTPAHRAGSLSDGLPSVTVAINRGTAPGGAMSQQLQRCYWPARSRYCKNSSLDTKPSGSDVALPEARAARLDRSRRITVRNGIHNRATSYRRCAIAVTSSSLVCPSCLPAGQAAALRSSHYPSRRAFTVRGK